MKHIAFKVILYHKENIRSIQNEEIKGINCQARLLLISAQISKFHSQSLNSETKGAELDN